MKNLFFVSLAFLVVLSGCKKSSSTQPEAETKGITVEITSTPAGANIDIDGGNSGKVTPYTFENLSPGSHRFKVYLNNPDYTQLDTTVFLQTNDHRTLSVIFKPLWNYSWSGSVRLNSPFFYSDPGSVRIWEVPCGTKTVPSSLNARIKVTYQYDSSRENQSTPGRSYGTIFVGNKSFDAKTSTTIIDKDTGLIANASSNVFVSAPQMIDTLVTVLSVVLETY